MPTNTTRSVERALDLLTVVCENPGINLTTAAQETDLSPSSALRLLHTLVENGFLNRDSAGLFEVGPQMLQLGFQVLEKNNLRSLCRPIMSELAQRTGESVYLSVRQQDTALYIGLAAGTHAVQHRSWEGQTIPLKGTAVGAALAGQVPPSPGASENNARPYAATSNAVEQDVMAIAAPIVVGKKTIAALSMLVPLYRIDEAKIRDYGQTIAHEARRISELFNQTKPSTTINH